MPAFVMNGVFPIIQTPFDRKGRIITEMLQKQVEWLIECGVDGVGIAMGSEIYKFIDDERDNVLKSVVEQVRGRVKVVMNTGAEGTEAAIYYSTRAEKFGADALMVRPPALFIPSQIDCENYFKKIAQSVSIPIFMQDQIPTPVAPALAAACAKSHKNLRYIKVESQPTVPRMSQTHKAAEGTGLIVFGGAGGTFVLEEFRRGSVGTMPHSTFADFFVRIWRFWKRGDIGAAETEFNRFLPILNIMLQGPGLTEWIAKFIMAKRGILDMNAAEVRHPGRKPDDAQFREIEIHLEGLDLVNN